MHQDDCKTVVNEVIVNGGLVELRQKVMNRVRLFVQTLGEHKRQKMGGGWGFNGSRLISTTAVPCWRIRLGELSVDRFRRQWGELLQKDNSGSKNAVQRIEHLDSWEKKSHRKLTKTKIHRSIGI